MQMEALTGWPARDEWEFDYLGTDSYNHPFIKANYPHHDGIWGWGTIAGSFGRWECTEEYGGVP